MTDKRHQRPSPVLTLGNASDENAVRDLAARIDAALSDGHGALVIHLGACAGVGNQTLAQLCSLLRGVSGMGTVVTVSGADPRVRWVLGLCEIHVLEPDPDAGDQLAVDAGTATGRLGHGWRLRLADWRRVRAGEESEGPERSTAG